MVIDMLTDLNRIFFVVLTKADKVNARQIEERSKVVCDYIQKAGSYCIPVIHTVSSLTQTESKEAYGMHELMTNLIFHFDQEVVFLPFGSKQIF